MPLLCRARLHSAEECSIAAAIEFLAKFHEQVGSASFQSYPNLRWLQTFNFFHCTLAVQFWIPVQHPREILPSRKSHAYTYHLSLAHYLYIYR